jgi:hypothetical protein
MLRLLPTEHHLLKTINPVAWNLSWVVPWQTKLFGLMKLFVSGAVIALMLHATHSLLSLIWAAPVPFVKTETVLN